MVRNRFSGGHRQPTKRFLSKGAGGLLILLAATAGRTQTIPVPTIPAPAMIRATPALWEIRDADTTIYLFGTFHTLDGHTVWFGDKVRQAFDASGELMLETIVPDPAAIQAAARGKVTETAGAVGYVVGQKYNDAFIAVNRLVKASEDVFFVGDRS